MDAQCKWPQIQQFWRTLGQEYYSDTGVTRFCRYNEGNQAPLKKIQFLKLIEIDFRLFLVFYTSPLSFSKIHDE